MLAIIPARGGSKGLPGKNIRLLNKIPLIAHSIFAAKSAKSIDKVIVSTEDEQIADIAKQYGADVPFLRPVHLASDNSLAIDNYIYTIEKLNLEFRYNICEFVVLQPTSPLRTPNDIDGAVNLFRKRNADSVISYTEESHPIYWHKFIDSDLKFKDIFHERITNRQDYKKTYYPNGAIFVFNYRLIKQRLYYSANSYAYLMPRERSIDIDTLEDFMYSEFILNNRHG